VPLKQFGVVNETKATPPTMQIRMVQPICFKGRILQLS